MLSINLGRMYGYSMAFIHLCYIAVFVGVFTRVPEYLDSFALAMQTVLCLVLMYRFRPFRASYRLHDSDARLIFGSATLLFINVVLVGLARTKYVKEYVRAAYGVRDQVKTYVRPGSQSKPQQKDDLQTTPAPAKQVT